MYPTWHDIDMDAYLWSIHVQGDAETAQTKQQEMREKVRISTEL